MFLLFKNKEYQSLTAKELLDLLPRKTFYLCDRTTDTFYTNAKTLHKIIYNGRYEYTDNDGNKVTLSRINYSLDDKKEFLKLVSKKLDLDRQKVILALEVHHRTIKEIEKVIKYK